MQWNDGKSNRGNGQFYEVRHKSNETGSIISTFTGKTKSAVHTFKIVTLWVHTQLHSLLPHFEAVLEVILRDAVLPVHELRRFPLHLLDRQKMSAFELDFDFGEEKKIARCEVRRIRRMIEDRNVFTSKKLSHKRVVRRSIVLMQNPASSPQLGSLPSDSLAQLRHDDCVFWHLWHNFYRMGS